MHISTIAVAEYAVGDNPANLPLNNIQIETFDFLDGEAAGSFHKELIGDNSNIQGYNRRIIANDVKILAQIKTKKIDAVISKDLNSLRKYINPLTSRNFLDVKFIDLNYLNINRDKVFSKLK